MDTQSSQPSSMRLSSLPILNQSTLTNVVVHHKDQYGTVYQIQDLGSNIKVTISALDVGLHLIMTRTLPSQDDDSVALFAVPEVSSYSEENGKLTVESKWYTFTADFIERKDGLSADAEIVLYYLERTWLLTDKDNAKCHMEEMYAVNSYLETNGRIFADADKEEVSKYANRAFMIALKIITNTGQLL